jgi:microcystin-dependent protein
MADTSKNIGVYYDPTLGDNILHADHINATNKALLTNESGGSVQTGDILVLGASADAGVTTSTTVGDLRKVVIVPANVTGDNTSAVKTIANGDPGWCYTHGYVPAANVSAAVSRWEYLKVSGTAKKLVGTGILMSAGNPIPEGACAIALQAIGAAGQVPVFLFVSPSSFFPISFGAPFFGSTAPAGWLICDGTAVSRTTYAGLFGAIGTTYGTGDGTTTFNLPDLRGRAPVGKDNMGGSSANRITAAWADSLGGSGGEENHTLITAEIPPHNHPFYGVNGGGSSQTRGSYVTDSIATNFPSGIIGDTGGGGAHNNLQPGIALNFIIKY